MAITLQIRSDVAALTESDHLLHDTLDILTLTPRPDATVRDTVSYQIVSEWELPPGHYQLRTSVTSAKMKRPGSVYLETDVPGFRKSTAQLSGLVVGYADPKRHAVDGTAVEHNLFPIEPVLDRAFARADPLRAYYDVWRRSPDIAATTSIEILNRQDQVVFRRADPIPPGTVGHVDATVPLSDLAPGPYRLRISASDASHTVSRVLGFLVRD